MMTRNDQPMTRPYETLCQRRRQRRETIRRTLREMEALDRPDLEPSLALCPGRPELSPGVRV